MGEEMLARTVILAVMVAAGVLLFCVAHAAASGRMGRNPVAGIRLPATMVSDEAWRVAHQAAKRPTQIAGWCAIAGALPSALPSPLPIAVASVFAGAAAMLIFVVYGAVAGSRAARALADHDGASTSGV